MPSGLRVTVDARPLDLEHLRTGGIGRYAHGLLGPLGRTAAERGGELVLLRQGKTRPSAFPGPAISARSLRVRRPRLPERLAELPEQLLLPLDIRRARPRVHHSLSPYRSALWPGVPVVMTMHDVIPLLWPERYLRTGAVHRMLYRAARRAKLLLAVSEATRRDLIAHLGVDPGRVAHVPEAVDPRFVPSDPAPVRERLGLHGPYLLWVGDMGTLDPRKDVAGLIDAFSRWRADHARTETLILAGRTGSAARELDRRSGAHVRFAGFVADEELPGLLSGASCLVSASRYEGFGLPALEAISCGTPVVAYDAGALPEVAGPGCLAVQPGDLAGLMRAAARVCDEPDLRRRLAGEGRLHAGGFTWERTAALTWDAYETVAYGAGSSP